MSAPASLQLEAVIGFNGQFLAANVRTQCPGLIAVGFSISFMSVSAHISDMKSTFYTCRESAKRVAMAPRW